MKFSKSQIILIKPVVIALVLLLRTWSSHAQLLAYEGFNYPVSAISNTTSTGGFGWGASWVIGAAGFNVVNTAPIPTYANLSVTGLFERGNPGFNNFGRLLDTSPGGNFATYLDGTNRIGAHGRTLWISFLISKPSNGNDNASLFGLHSQASVNNAFANLPNFLNFGYGGSAYNVGGVRYWGLRIFGSTDQVSLTNRNVVNNRAEFAVLKIEFGSSVSGVNTLTGVSLFLNPVLDGNEPTSPTIFQLTTVNLAFNRIAIRQSDGGSMIDEIRFGGSYFDVTPLNGGVGLVSISGGNISVDKGTSQLTANILPLSAQTPINVSWSANNATVATISGTGLLQGLRNGQVTVTATAIGPINTVVGTIVINVSNQFVNIGNVTLTGFNTTLGGTSQMSYNYAPLDATLPIFANWSSSNPLVATISGTGLLTGISVGTTTVAATVFNANSTVVGFTQISVTPAPVALNAITVLGNDIFVDNGTSNMTYSYSPNDASQPLSVLWSVLPTDLASISGSGILQAVKDGSVTVTAVVFNSFSTVTGTKIVALTNQIIPISAITVTGGVITNAMGELQINYQYAPIDATNPSIRFVANNSFGTVSGTGLLKAIYNGVSNVSVIVSNSVSTISGNVNVTITGQPSPQGLLVYEDFNYGGGNSINNTNGGFGWSSMWMGSNIVATNNGLLKNLFITNGQAINVTGGFQSASRGLDISGPLNEYLHTDNRVYKPGKVLWVSMLMSNGTLTGTNRMFLHSENIPVNSPTSFIAIGAQDIAPGRWLILCSTAPGVLPLDADGFSFSGAHKQADPIVASEPTLLVLKIEFASTVVGGNTFTGLSLYVNPSLTGTEPATPSAKMHVHWSISAIRAITSRLTGNAVQDEIRMGTTFESVTPAYVPLSGITFSGSNTISTLEGNTQLNYVYSPTNATQPVNKLWSVSNSSIASVDQNGFVQALNNGVVNISVTLSNFVSTITGIFPITITGQDRPLTSVSISGANNVFVDKAIVQLSLNYLPTNASLPVNTQWSVSNPSLATINGSGALKALDNGVVTVTAIASNFISTLSGIHVVTISNQNIGIESMTFSGGNTISTNRGNIFFTTPYNPTDVAAPVVRIFTVSNPSIATINGVGLLTALNNGVVTVTGTISNPYSTVSGSIVVTVSGQFRRITSLTISGEKLLKVGETSSLSFSYLPNNTSYSNLAWSSSASSIVGINTNGQIVGFSRGIATIRLTIANIEGSITGTYFVTVTGTDTLSISTLKKDIVIGDTLTLIVEKSGILISSKAVIWSSSDTLIAKIDSNGSLMALSEGVVTISGTSKTDSSIIGKVVLTIIRTNSIDQEIGAVRVHPNPTHSHLHITDIGNTVKNVILMDLSGSILYEQNRAGTIDISNISRGLKLLKITAQNGEVNYHKVILD